MSTSLPIPSSSTAAPANDATASPTFNSRSLSMVVGAFPRPRFLTADYPELAAAVDMSRRVNRELKDARKSHEDEIKAIRERKDSLLTNYGEEEGSLSIEGEESEDVGKRMVS